MIELAVERTGVCGEASVGRDEEQEWSRQQTLEAELRALEAFMPDVTKDIRLIFDEAVTDSLWDMLPVSEARALMMLVGATNFESPPDVYAALDSILGEGSRILKTAITKEFRSNVHLLMEKVNKEFEAGCSFSKCEHQQNFGFAKSWA